jgi:hypothetical protein
MIHFRKQNMRYYRLLAVSALILTSALPIASDAKVRDLPATMPGSPNLEIDASCSDQARGRIVALLSALRRQSATPARASNDAWYTEEATGVPMRRVHSGSSTYLLFRTSRDGALHMNDVMTCLTVYASNGADARRLGYFIPDDRTPIGSFVYNEKLGVYIDPRAVTAIGSQK